MHVLVVKLSIWKIVRKYRKQVVRERATTKLISLYLHKDGTEVNSGPNESSHEDSSRHSMAWAFHLLWAFKDPCSQAVGSYFCDAHFLHYEYATSSAIMMIYEIHNLPQRYVCNRSKVYTKFYLFSNLDWLPNMRITTLIGIQRSKVMEREAAGTLFPNWATHTLSLEKGEQNLSRFWPGQFVFRYQPTTNFVAFLGFLKAPSMASLDILVTG